MASNREYCRALTPEEKRLLVALRVALAQANVCVHGNKLRRITMRAVAELRRLEAWTTNDP